MSSHRWIRLAVGSFALAAFSGGLAVGASVRAIPGPDGIVHGCYRDRTGALRVIDAAIDKCQPDETALSWAQQGPAGPAGLAGPMGPAGPSGAPGISAGVAGYEMITTSALNSGTSAIYEIDATCTTGKKPLGGGWRQDPEPATGVMPTLQDSYPTATGWHVRAYLRPGLTVYAYAICAVVNP